MQPSDAGERGGAAVRDAESVGPDAADAGVRSAWVSCEAADVEDSFDTGDFRHEVWVDSRDDENPDAIPFAFENGGLHVRYAARSFKVQHALVRNPAPTPGASCLQVVMRFTLKVAPDNTQVLSFNFGDDHVVYAGFDTPSGVPNIRFVEQLFDHDFDKTIARRDVALDAPHVLVFRFHRGATVADAPAYEAWLDDAPFELDTSELKAAPTLQQIFLGAPFAPPSAQADFTIDDIRIQ